jgi:hypothetical protein
MLSNLAAAPLMMISATGFSYPDGVSLIRVSGPLGQRPGRQLPQPALAALGVRLFLV